MEFLKECIAAIATALAPAGLGVVRLSGENSIEIAAKFFKSSNISKDIKLLNGYEAAYGRILDGGFFLDDGVALVFKAPYSYTGEDVVEITCHGGLLILKELLNICVKNGARLATNGEFTKRAFLNGKLSLTQAEAVADVINAESVACLKAVNEVKNGVLYKKAKEISDKLVELDSNILVWLDYPLDDLPDIDILKFKGEIKNQKLKLDSILQNVRFEDILKNGVQVALVGRPNVGKSTLMNLICGEEKSIVTNISGTTRDVVSASVSINGFKFKIFDTAGITDSSNVVEKLGVERAISKLKSADIILLVTDNLTKYEDLDILKNYENSNIILIYNKADLNYCKKCFSKYKFSKVVTTSHDDYSSIEKLKQAIYSVKQLGSINFNNMPLILNSRQKTSLESASKILDKLLLMLNSNIALDAIGVVLEDAIDELLKLTGEKVSDVVLEDIFSKFCVGK